MMRREIDASFANRVASEVKADMGVVDDLDFSAVVADGRNHVLSDKGFIAMFIWSAPHVYECHIMGLRGHRGKHAIEAGKEMLAYMKRIGAVMVWGQPALSNRAALWYVSTMGLKHVGDGDNPMVGPVRYFVTERL